MTPSTQIYAITDAKGVVMYVGKARMSLRERLLNHSYTKTPIGEWVRENAETVKIRLLEEVPQDREREAEQQWIDWYVDNGAPLLNKRKKLKFAHALKESKA